MSHVTVSLAGGLGNQMFQFATARAVSLRNGIAHPTLDLHQLSLPKRARSTTKRSFELGFLASDSHHYQESQGPGEKSWWWAVAGRIRDRKKGVFTERDFTFQPEVLTLTPPVSLEGYFQSEKYFEEFTDVIRQDFAYQPEIVPQRAREKYQEIASQKSLGVHVRRGDYVNNPTTKAFHGPLDIDYYKKSLDAAYSLGHFDKVFVFSDDPDWVMGQTLFDDDEVIAPAAGPSITDLWLMSACSSFIIANTTFSWWAAWLAKSPDKKVIYPEPWFSGSPGLEVDLLPRAWTPGSR